MEDLLGLLEVGESRLKRLLCAVQRPVGSIFLPFVLANCVMTMPDKAVATNTTMLSYVKNRSFKERMEQEACIK